MLFVGVWIARYLGPDSFGLLAFAQSLVFLFTAFTTLGLDNVIVRNIVLNEEPVNEILGSSFVLKLIGALVVLPTIFFTTGLLGEDSTTKLIVFIISSSLVFQSFNVIDFYFRAHVLSKYVSIANTVSLVLSSILKIILIMNEAPLIYFAIVSVFDALVVSIGLVYFYQRQAKVKIYKWNFSWKTSRLLLNNSWPLFFSSIVVSLYMKIDQVMLNYMIDQKAVGLYSAAVKISEAWYLIPMAIVSSVFPAIINAKKSGTFLYEKRLLRLYTLMVWMGLTLALVITFSSEWLILAFYGPAYEQASTVLTIHIWSGIFVFLGIAFSKYLITERLVMKAFYRTACGAILNIILNILLIPQFGITGAAVATLISQLVANLLYDFFDYELRGVLYLKLFAFNIFHPIHWKM